MRRALCYLGMALCLLAARPARGQSATMFTDVPRDHWAYTVVADLQAHGLLLGYPAEVFKGRRTLTRYEFAVAVERLFVLLPRDQPARPLELPGNEMSPPPVNLTVGDVRALRRLLTEFKSELAAFGSKPAELSAQLDTLQQRMEKLQRWLDGQPEQFQRWLENQPRWFASAPAGAGGSTPAATAPLTLGAHPPIAGRYGNGADYHVLPGGLQLDAGRSIGPYAGSFAVQAPLGMLGRGGSLTLGRFAERFSRLTFWQPEVSLGLNAGVLGNGGYLVNGVRAATRMGDVTARMTAGRLDSDPYDALWSSPTGPSLPRGLGWARDGYGGGLFPAPTSGLGAMTMGRMAAVNVGLDMRALGGQFNVTAADFGGDVNPASAGTAPNFNNVSLVGANTNLRLADRITLAADWARSVTGTNRVSPTGVGQNSAFSAEVGYASGALNLAAGYRYIDPAFYAPGYWGRIGNWINPTNVAGPTFRAAYEFSPSFGIKIGGDIFSAARNGSDGLPAGAYGLSSDDDIYRAVAGLRYDLSRNFHTTVDYEGVYYSLGANSALGNALGSVHPTEQYITFGTGYSFSNSALIKLNYSIGQLDGYGPLSAAQNGSRYTFSSVRSSLVIKF